MLQLFATTAVDHFWSSRNFGFSLYSTAISMMQLFGIHHTWWVNSYSFNLLIQFYRFISRRCTVFWCSTEVCWSNINSASAQVDCHPLAILNSISHPGLFISCCNYCSCSTHSVFSANWYFDIDVDSWYAWYWSDSDRDNRISVDPPATSGFGGNKLIWSSSASLMVPSPWCWLINLHCIEISIQSGLQTRRWRV